MCLNVSENVAQGIRTSWCAFVWSYRPALPSFLRFQGSGKSSPGPTRHLVSLLLCLLLFRRVFVHRFHPAIREQFLRPRSCKPSSPWSSSLVNWAGWWSAPLNPLNHPRIVSSPILLMPSCHGETDICFLFSDTSSSTSSSVVVPSSLAAARFDPNSFRRLSQLLETIGLSHYAGKAWLVTVIIRKLF